MENWTAAGLAKAIRKKELSSEEIVKAYLTQIEKINPELNAVVFLREAALTEARQADKKIQIGKSVGPLHGVPVTVKDSFGVKNTPTTCGTIGRKDFITKEDAVAVSRLKNAGAIVIAKTNLPELCLAYETDNNLFGRSNNPYDLSRTPGGSSGGEASLIAAFGTPLGLGSDSGGSIRIPAAFCGITGLKPTSGAVPEFGHFPIPGGLRHNFMQPGPLARSIADLRLAFSVLANQQFELNKEESTPCRVAFFTNNGVIKPMEEIVSAIESTAKVMSNLGMNVEEKCPENMQECFNLISAMDEMDGGTGIMALLESCGTSIEDCHPLTKYLISSSKTNSASLRIPMKVEQLLDQYRSVMLKFMQDFDVLLCPAFISTAFKHGMSLCEASQQGFSYVYSFNILGWPVVTMPVKFSQEHLPIGIQLAACPGKDFYLLQVAECLQDAIHLRFENPIFHSEK